MTSQRVKNKKYDTRRSWVVWLLYTVTSSVIHYGTHTWKNVIYLFYTIKFQMGYWRILGGMKKDKQVCWRNLTWIWRHLCCVFGQQPMKMLTEVTLLYKPITRDNGIRSSWYRYVVLNHIYRDFPTYRDFRYIEIVEVMIYFSLKETLFYCKCNSIFIYAKFTWSYAY